MTFLSAAELEHLASKIADPYGVVVRFLGWTGLRIGEAAALRVGRLDLLARRIEVVEAATEVNGWLAWGRPRPASAASFRCHDSSPSSLALTWPTDPTPLPILCSPCRVADRCGSPSGASGTSARQWRRPGWGEGLRVHDLRHTAASLAIRENASVKIVQAMLGHRSATQTLDRYGHLYPSDLDALAERLDAAHAAAATEV